MGKEKNTPCRKRSGKKVSYEFKIFVIEQINNGQISLNYASKKYNISRSTIAYWRKKLSSYASNQKSMGLKEENKRLKDQIEGLELVKEMQQDIIAEFEKLTGKELSKKSLPGYLAEEIRKNKKKLSK